VCVCVCVCVLDGEGSRVFASRAPVQVTGYLTVFRELLSPPYTTYRCHTGL